MCGIFACHKCFKPIVEFKATALQLSKAIRHRGPDWSGNIVKNNTILCHERLAVVGVGKDSPVTVFKDSLSGIVLIKLVTRGADSGAQPIVNSDQSLILAVNGEIYNHRALRKALTKPHTFKTHSDCEVILHLYEEIDVECADKLDGFFSFVLHDIRDGRDRIIAARDPIGVTTLYQGWLLSSPDTVFFASEVKCLQDVCDKVISFPPGHIYDSETGKTTPWYKPPWWDGTKIPHNPLDLKLLRETLERAVRKRLMSEVPYGVLLSGGLDSSLIAAIAARETERVLAAQKAKGLDGFDVFDTLSNGEGAGIGVDDDDNAGLAAWPRLHSFSIGLPGSPDLKAAHEVAKYLGTVHHEHTFTIEEGLDALQDVIYHLETYDVTTIRASTPMYLLSRKIKAQGVKMVLSGEGSDEIFAGYLYFHVAPTPAALHEECVARVKNLNVADCLRANKSTMAWGLEARVPFLDKAFLDVAMMLDPKEKMITKERMEKYVLRKAFDTSDDPSARPYLPHHILWRQKEQFSDGVGYGWIDALKDEANIRISDEQFKVRKAEWGNDVPDTKEAYWYRLMFDNVFKPHCSDTVKRWIPSWGAPSDPSGRAQKNHAAHKADG